MTEPLLYTLEEACQVLFSEGYNDAARKRIRRWIKTGVIQAMKDGRRWYIPAVELQKFGSKQWEKDGNGQKSKKPLTLHV